MNAALSEHTYISIPENLPSISPRYQIHGKTFRETDVSSTAAGPNRWLRSLGLVPHVLSIRVILIASGSSGLWFGRIAHWGAKWCALWFANGLPNRLGRAGSWWCSSRLLQIDITWWNDNTDVCMSSMTRDLRCTQSQGKCISTRIHGPGFWHPWNVELEF